jgi:hypothetical protein
MEGGVISGNIVTEQGGGVQIYQSTFTLKGGTIYGNNADDNANETRDDRGVPVTGSGAAFEISGGVPAKWGTGGTYTKGGVAQTGGSDIGTTDDTLIAIPAP